MFNYSVQYKDDNNIWQNLTGFARPIKNKSTLDTTHDESEIYLPNSELSSPFKPFTKFIINITEVDDNGEIIDTDTLYRVVITDSIEQVTFTEPKAYRHNIHLSEPSKELERYSVDNLSFTNVWAKTYGEGKAVSESSMVSYPENWFYLPEVNYGD